MKLQSKNILSIIGAMAQLMPGCIRHACRSHITYEEDEWILYLSRDAREKLEDHHLRDKFAFVEKHIGILGELDPKEIRSFIRSRRHYGKASLMPFCRYETDGKKLSCCSCPHVREIIDFYGEKGKHKGEN